MNSLFNKQQQEKYKAIVANITPSSTSDATHYGRTSFEQFDVGVGIGFDKYNYGFLKYFNVRNIEDYRLPNKNPPGTNQILTGLQDLKHETDEAFQKNNSFEIGKAFGLFIGLNWIELRFNSLDSILSLNGDAADSAFVMYASILAHYKKLHFDLSIVEEDINKYLTSKPFLETPSESIKELKKRNFERLKSFY